MRYKIDAKTMTLLFDVLAQVQREARQPKAVKLSQADFDRLVAPPKRQDPKVVNLWESVRSKKTKARK